MFWADLTFEWYEDAIVFSLFIFFFFLFRTGVKKGYLNFRHFYGNFFKIVILRVT